MTSYRVLMSLLPCMSLSAIAKTLWCIAAGVIETCLRCAVFYWDFTLGCVVCILPCMSSCTSHSLPTCAYTVVTSILNLQARCALLVQREGCALSLGEHLRLVGDDGKNRPSNLLHEDLRNLGRHLQFPLPDFAVQKSYIFYPRGRPSH